MRTDAPYIRQILDDLNLKFVVMTGDGSQMRAIRRRRIAIAIQHVLRDDRILHT
jgi:hypothetical protein